MAAVVVSVASGSLFFLFDPTSAVPGQRVTVRLGGTPAGFTAAQRKPPLGRPIRLYLVPSEVAADVRTRIDPRIHFVGLLVPDRNARGVLVFQAPPLDSGSYVVAAWCPDCARTSAGRTFFVLAPAEVGRYRDLMRLQLELPSAESSCPVTRGSYGNGLLSTPVPGPNGVLVAATDQRGTLFQKLGWLPHRGLTGTLTVRGDRLDGPGRLRVLGAFWGHSSDGRGSWMSPVEFPSEGCWRISGRVRDVSLTYVVKVVAG